MNKITAFCFLLLIVTEPVFTQPKEGSITGTVTDRSTNKPIEGADVTLLSEKDSSAVSGTTTGPDGKFMLSALPPGRYFLRANLVGYNFAAVSGIVINRNNSNIVLETIRLSQSTTTTEEILVEEEKSLIEFKPDKKVFNVSKNLTTQGSTLIDLLKEIPSVTVDQDGNVSLRGSEGVKITIDGRPFGMEGQGRNIILEQVPANEVERIELITNPSAKYEAEGSVGIINVVLKKSKPQSFGYNGNLGVNISTGDKYNGQLSISLKNSRLNVYGNYSYDVRNYLSEGFNDRNYFTNSAISSIMENNSGSQRGRSHLLKLGLDYNIDKSSVLGLTFNYRKSDRSRGNTSYYRESDNTNTAIREYYSFSSDLDKGTTYDINANFFRTFKDPKHNLSAEFSFSRDSDDESELNSETFIFPVNNTPEKRNEYSIETDDQLRGKIDYIYPVSKDIKIETGYNLRYDKRDFDFKVENYDYNINGFVTDLSQTNRFIYKQQVHAVYGIYTQQLGSFGFSLGGRTEYTFIRGELTGGTGDFERSYIDFFPSASISQKTGASSEIQASYSRRIHRPRHRELNPFRSYWGSNNYRQGNPEIDPEYTDSYELSFIKYFRWATITPGLFYRYTKNEITPQRTLLDSTTTLTMPVNLNNSRSYGSELIINSQPAKFISLNGTVSYYKTEVDANNITSGLTNSASSWSARAMSTILLPADFTLQLTYFYRGKRVTAQGTMEPFQTLDAALRKDLFNKRLSLSLRVNDILDKAKFRVSFNDPSFSEVFERRRDSRTIMLNVTYNFGQKDSDKQNKRRKKDNQDNNEDEDTDF